MELHGELKTASILEHIIEDIRTVKKKRPDKNFITREAIKQGLPEELLSSSLNDLVCAGRLYVDNGSYFVSKTKQVKSNRVTENVLNGSTEPNFVGKNASTEPVIGEKSSSFKKTMSSQHFGCPALKSPVTNSAVPDFRIYETAGQLAATVAESHQIHEREREREREVLDVSYLGEEKCDVLV